MTLESHFQKRAAPGAGPGFKIGSGGPVTVEAPRKIGRNDPCICGSGKKYKKCCGKE